MDDTARVLLTAAVLSATGLAAFAWRISRIDSSQPEHLIGQLRLAQVSAIALAALGAMPVGLAIAGSAVPGANLDAVAGIGFVVLAGFVLMQAPREALLMLAIGFVAHALFALAHRPGLLTPEVMPRWYAVACATYDLCLAAICFWGRRG